MLLPSLLRRRLLIPTCLALSVLLCDLPAPAAPPLAPAAGQAQTIPLQHVVPGDILKLMHWDQAASLPPGVTQIRAVPETNSLAVIATPDGFAKVKELVRILDFVPRQVQIKFAVAHATEADLKASGISFDIVPLAEPQRGADTVFVLYATGSSAAGLQKTLAKQGAFSEAPTLTTTNNVAASLTLTTTVHAQLISSVTLAVTPRINSDDSVTLGLHPVFQDGAVRREVKTLRTVKYGDTMVIIMPSDAAGVGRDNLLLFTTPIVLSTKADTPTKPIK